MHINNEFEVYLYLYLYLYLPTYLPTGIPLLYLTHTLQCTCTLFDAPYV